MTVTALHQQLTADVPGTSRAVQRRRSRRWLVVRVVLAAVVCLVMVFPLWVMVVTAFSGTAVFSQQLELWPQRFTLAGPHGRQHLRSLSPEQLRREACGGGGRPGGGG